jgi:hypothetical protein
VLHSAHTGDGVPGVNEVRHVRAHPALEGGKGLGLPAQRRQKHRLRHPDRLRILGGNQLERELADLLAVQPNFARVEKRMRVGQHVLEQPELIQEPSGARLQHFAAVLAVEIFVSLQDQDVCPTFG